MWGNLGHLFLPFSFFLASVSIVGVIRGNGLLDGLDRVTLYTYSKAPIDRGAALLNHTSLTGEWAWLGDQADAAHCLDMRALNFPVVGFIPGSDPTGPSCHILLTNHDAATTPPALSIVPVYTQGSVEGCVPGTYPLEISGGRSGPVRATNLYIAVASVSTDSATGPVVSSQVTVTVPGTVALSSTGYSSANGAQWQLCLQRRLALAGQFLNGTSCQQESSQLCTCVRGFANKLTDPAHALAAVLPNGMPLQDALLGGVDSCLQLRRAHDVRAAAPGAYFRSGALLSFALALLINAALYFALLSNLDRWVRAATHLAWFSLLFVMLNGGGTESSVALSVLLPPLLSLLAYSLYVETFVASDLQAQHVYLHPVAFDLCLCQLTLYTLVERGVVQREYLIGEVFKCHAVAAVYAAQCWYHRYRYLTEEAGAGAASEGGSGGLASAGVEHAHLLLQMSALAAASDTLLVPYPSKAPFQIHWLLPLALTCVALSNPSWAYAQFARAKRAPREPEVALHAGGGSHHFNNRAAALVSGVFLVLLGYFLIDHIRTYGAGHYPYPSYLSAADGGLSFLVRTL